MATNGHTNNGNGAAGVADTFATACVHFVAAARVARVAFRGHGDNAVTRAAAVDADVAARAVMRAVEYVTAAAAAAFNAGGVTTGVDTAGVTGRATRTRRTATPGNADAGIAALAAAAAAGKLS